METAASTDRRNAASSDQGAHSWDRLLPSDATEGALVTSGSLESRRVLITGAGGSIGAAIAKAAAASKPASLILFDSSENALYQVDRRLRQTGSQRHVSILGSLCDPGSVEHAIAVHQPEVIFHAAALKHVPLMEENPFAAIETNVFGTLTLMEAASAHDVAQMVLISTDKAVDACSMMGASKRIAELLVLSSLSLIRRTVVRLCNVMGSQGSVLPLFLEQIAKGGPITVTDPEVQRYFLTIDEAIRAVFDALLVSSSPALLLPSIAPAVRIVDLARHLLELHGSSATIAFTGLRPGDKLIEKLVSSREFFSSHDVYGSGLRAIQTPLAGGGELSAGLNALREAIARRDLRQLLDGVWALVPEYQPSKVITTALKNSSAQQLAPEIQA